MFFDFFAPSLRVVTKVYYEIEDTPLCPSALGNACYDILQRVLYQASLSLRQKSANSLQMSLALRSPLCSPVQPLAPLVRVSGAAVGTSPLHRSAS